MALHEQSVGATDEWFTPPYVFDAFGCEFDMDVASPGQDLTPWIPARRFVTCHGLAAPWSGFVWMNPPFGPRNGIVPWLEKFFAHGNGIAARARPHIRSVVAALRAEGRINSVRQPQN